MGSFRKEHGPFPYAEEARTFDYGERVGVVFRYRDGTRKALKFTAEELLVLRGLERTP